MSEMVLRVMEAIAQAHRRDNADYEDLARAAMAAMREPTAAMATAGSVVEPNNDNSDGLPTASEIWRAMIDEALKT